MIVFNPFTGAFDYVSDPATTTTKGVIKLAGDLGGTADLPTVPGLATAAQYTPQRPTAGFTVPANTQILYSMDIDLQAANGDLTINGILQGVH